MSSQLSEEWLNNGDIVLSLAKDLLSTSPLRYLKTSWRKARSYLTQRMEEHQWSFKRQLEAFQELVEYHTNLKDLRERFKELHYKRDVLAIDPNCFSTALQTVEQLKSHSPVSSKIWESSGLDAMSFVDSVEDIVGIDAAQILINAAKYTKTRYPASSLNDSKKHAEQDKHHLNQLKTDIYELGLMGELSKAILDDIKTSLEALLIECIGEDDDREWSFEELWFSAKWFEEVYSKSNRTHQKLFVSVLENHAPNAVEHHFKEFVSSLIELRKTWDILCRELHIDENILLTRKALLCPFSELRDRLIRLEKGIPQLVTWAKLQGKLRVLLANESPVKSLVEHYISSNNLNQKLADTFTILLTHCRVKELDKKNIIPCTSGSDVDSLRRTLADLHKEGMDDAVHAIKKVISKTPIDEGCNIGRRGEWTGLHLIRHELGKQSRRIAPRKLIMRSLNALQGLMPCFMMSSTTVAQTIPPSIGSSFDLVVIDEASQMLPEEPFQQ